VRMLDNVVDASHFPLPQQKENATETRRIGLGITGLADALLMLGVTYGSERSPSVAADIMRTICHAAYRASIALAEEKGSFPALDKERYLSGAFVRRLPEDILEGIAKIGIRNSHLLAIAPTGTISLLAGNVSSGLEPIFSASQSRRMVGSEVGEIEVTLTDYAVALWRERHDQRSGLPAAFVAAADIPASKHLDMQAALQPYVDNSISKTINVPERSPFADYRNIFELAYDKGLKGCTTFRPNPVTGSVLTASTDGTEAPHCCVLEREAD